jgi:hypothetical protein
MNVIHHLMKGKKTKKVDESSSSKSQSGTPNSLFQVNVYFNFHLLFSLLFTILYSYFLFVGHFIEGVPKVGDNGGFDRSQVGVSRAGSPADDR